MSTRLLLRPEARLDIEEATLWYEDQRPGLGRRLADEFTSLLDRIRRLLSNFPVSAKACEEASSTGFPYAVYFLLERTPSPCSLFSTSAGILRSGNDVSDQRSFYPHPCALSPRKSLR